MDVRMDGAQRHYFVGSGLFIPDGNGQDATPLDTRDGDGQISLSAGHVAWEQPGLRLPGRGDKEIHCALVLDLGNSRSAGVILDDFDGAAFHVIPLELKGFGGVPGDDGGVFNSIITIEAPRHTGWERISCMRCGRRAEDLARKVHGQNAGGSYEYSFASPKLSFWDDDEQFLERVGFVFPAGEKMRVLPSKENPKSAARFRSRSDLIGEMVVELLEQGESNVNRWALAVENGELEIPNKSHWRPGVRRITHVALTYPTCWTRAEIISYAEQVQRKINQEWVIRLGYQKVQVVPTIDEASAVALAYAMNEIERQQPGVAGDAAEKWVRAINGGRTESRGDGIWNDYVATIAVLDIGGGTSDLAVNKLRFHEKGSSVERHGELTVETENGICVAGNEFMRKILERILLPGVIKILNEENEKEHWGDLLKDELAKPQSLPLKKELCIYYFQKLALNYAMEEAGKEELKNSCKEFVERLKQIMPDVTTKDSKLAEEFLKEWGEGREAAEKLEIVARETFAEVLIAPLKEVLRENNPDLVLLAGKPFELEVIRNAILGELPDDVRKKFKPLGTYDLSPFWEERYSGVEFDVKLLTVIGGAIAFMKSGTGRKAPTPGFNDIRIPSPEGHGLLWKPCNLAEATRPNARLWISEGDEDCLDGQRISRWSGEISREIGFVHRRKGLDSMPAQLGYLLEFKPEYRECGSMHVTVVVGKSETLALDSESAQKATLKLYVHSGESSWMETGAIRLDGKAVEAGAVSKGKAPGVAGNGGLALAQEGRFDFQPSEASKADVPPPPAMGTDIVPESETGKGAPSIIGAPPPLGKGVPKPTRRTATPKTATAPLPRRPRIVRQSQPGGRQAPPSGPDNGVE